MRKFILIAALGLLPAMAQGAVTVRFVEPQSYTDAGRRYSDSDLAALERHLVSLGDCLKSGDRVDLSILDVDLAGRKEWWRGPAYDVRVMREITWPRIQLEYAWHDAAGKLVDQRRERVADMNYLWRSAYVRNDPDVLPYEKAMLRDWFEGRFCPKTG